MCGGAVSLVLGEAMAGEVTIEIDHHLVPHHLGNDGGGSYVKRAGVAMSEGELGGRRRRGEGVTRRRGR